MAATLVVYLHAAQVAVKATGSSGLLPAQLQVTGQSGVDIFFVISGVIITRSARSMRWQDFAWKRFRRIAPLYWLVCIAAVLIALRGGAGLTWRGLLATFLLWPATDTMTAPLVGVAWTLCFEALFYVAATLVVADRRWLAPLLCGFSIAMIMRGHGPVFQFLGNPLILEFLMGVAAACAAPAPRAVWLIPVGAAGLLAAGFAGLTPTGTPVDFLTTGGSLTRVLVFGVPAALIVFGVLQAKASESALTRQGDASYALYLTHPMIMSPTLALWAVLPLPPDAIIALLIGASILFGWRVHVSIEAPLMAWADARRKRSLKLPRGDASRLPSSAA